MNASLTLILDGWLGSPWRMEWLRRNLEKNSLPALTWKYDTSGKSGLGQLASNLAGYVENTAMAVNLVGFSMGGIVIREALRQQPALRVAGMVCLNSPHHGTAPARFLTRPALQELRFNSPFLQRLNSSPCPVPFLNVWCPGDLVVLPGLNARHPTALEEICSWMPAHAWPLLSSRLHRKVAGFLRTPFSGNSQNLISTEVAA